MRGEFAIFTCSRGRVGYVVDEEAVMSIGEFLRCLVRDFGEDYGCERGGGGGGSAGGGVFG